MNVFTDTYKNNYSVKIQKIEKGVNGEVKSMKGALNLQNTVIDIFKITVNLIFVLAGLQKDDESNLVDRNDDQISSQVSMISLRSC